MVPLSASASNVSLKAKGGGKDYEIDLLHLMEQKEMMNLWSRVLAQRAFPISSLSYSPVPYYFLRSRRYLFHSNRILYFGSIRAPQSLLSVTVTQGPWLLPHLIAMGACLSSPTAIEVSEHDKILHREVEKQLKEVRYYHQVVSCSRLTDRHRPRQRWRRKSRFGHPTSFDTFHSNTLIRGAGSASWIRGFRKVDSPQGAYLRNRCNRPH